jgi:exopolysaccharide biosynthesis polyprenyl glycosylphosphotransferase
MYGHINSACLPREIKKRTPLYIINIMHDLIFPMDILAGIALGYCSILVYLSVLVGAPLHWQLAGSIWREILLASLIAALVLRDPPSASTRLAAAQHTRIAWGPRACAAIGILVSVGLLTRSLNDMARVWIIAWSLLFAAWIMLSRTVFSLCMNSCDQPGQAREAIAILGAPDVAGRVASRLGANADVVAVMNDIGDAQGNLGPENLVTELREMAGAGAIDTIIIALDQHHGDDVQLLIEHLKSVPVQLALFDEALTDTDQLGDMRMLGTMPMRIVTDRPISGWSLLQKELLDKIGAIALLLLLSPIMLAAALAIMIEHSGPIIFRQNRTGWSGRPFTIYKFRTMYLDCDINPFRQTMRNDPRCTAVGAFLRRTSIDELPQLWNVLRGDMSLVGPRPHADRLHKADIIGCQLIAEYAQRQRVKPGLTGWAQINGARGAVASVDQMQRRVAHDLYYIENWSIWLDLRILACTPASVLVADNAF